MITVLDIFRVVRLEPCGPYVVVSADGEVVYVGRTRRALRKRLREFYRHRYGDKRPHRGGQAILLLTRPLLVYWAATNDWEAAEDTMIEHFRSAAGRLPFGNRVRSARLKPKPMIDDAREARLDEPHVRPLMDLVRGLRARGF
jgi:hypothetical protein